MASRRSIFALLMFAAAAPAVAAPIDASRLDPSSLVDLGIARFAKVSDDGTIILNDGRKLRLAGIELAQGRSTHDLQTALDQLTGSDPIELRADGPAEDRYGRVVAQAFAADGTWIEGALLRLGLARVATTPDHRSLAPALYTAERAALAHHLGLWADPRTALRHAEAISRFIDSWQVVDGTVVAANPRHNAVDLQLGDDESHDLTIRIPISVAQTMDSDPSELVGRHLRVRGWIGKGVGPLIVLNHPEQIELVGRKRRKMADD